MYSVIKVYKLRTRVQRHVTMRELLAGAWQANVQVDANTRPATQLSSCLFRWFV